MFYCQPKNKTENNFLVISGSSLHFSNLCCKFFCEKSINNTFQIYGEKTQRQVSFKTKLKWINFRTNWIVLENHILKKQNTFRGKTHFPVIKNTIKQIHSILESMNESSMIFQSFYMPTFAELLSCAPTLFGSE